MGKSLPLFSVSVAIITYQLLLIQVLSISQWYHFAYMIISVALLGFGASGTLLSIFKNTIMNNTRLFAPLFLWACSFMMVLSLHLTQSSLLAFDSYLVFQDTTHFIKLLITCLIFFLPFLFGALYIGLVFRIHSQSIGKLYFYNLSGSALGGLLLIPLMHWFSPQQAIPLVALFPLLGTLLSVSIQKIRWVIIIVFTLLIIILATTRPPELFLSEYKSLSKVLNLPETEIIAVKTSPYGLLQAVKSPYLRYGPGLSFNYQKDNPFDIVIFNNGDFVGPLLPLNNDQSVQFYDYSTKSLPFVISEGKKALVLDAGGGSLASYAAYRGFTDVVAVDSNPDLFEFIDNELKEFYGPSIYEDPSIRTVAQDPYSYLLTSDDHYDVIVLPLADAFGGSAGIFAMQEKYLLTGGSFDQMWSRLSDDGMITMSTWIDFPLRYPLKTLTTLVELLERKNISEPEAHLIAIRNWSLITFVLSKRPISEEESDQVRVFAEDLGFDILLLPDIQEEERERFHLLSDSSLFGLVDQIITGEREELYRNYQFNIKPSTKNRPYFFQFLKVERIPELLQDFDRRTLPFLELGYLLVFLTFLQIALLTTIFILLPLKVRKGKPGGRLWTFFYFAALGLGYMMLEMILIQRFISYFGTPLYSTAAVITAILLFSGLGSYCSSNISTDRRNFTFVLLLAAFLITIYALSLGFVIQATIQLNLLIKILLTLVIVAPLAFLLGFPFPLGIRLLGNTAREDEIVWAWGINGSFSVISTVLAIIIAVEAGFFVVMLIAALCYLFAMLSHYLFPPAKRNKIRGRSL